MVFLISAASLFGFVLFGSYISSPNENTVERCDLVTIDYQMWESDNAKNYDPLNPIFDEVIVITMIPLTEDPEKGLILGLYNNIIGKTLYYESDLIWLDRCIDQDRNGVDDMTREPALSYGNSTDQYFNTCLMIKFKVLSIL